MIVPGATVGLFVAGAVVGLFVVAGFNEGCIVGTIDGLAVSIALLITQVLAPGDKFAFKMATSVALTTPS